VFIRFRGTVLYVELRNELVKRDMSLLARCSEACSRQRTDQKFALFLVGAVLTTTKYSNMVM
jgi:hypothetical protein